MANSRDRRKLRRQLQEAGLGHLLTPPPSPSPPTPLPTDGPFWRKIPGWVWWIVTFFATLITLLGGYPWLSVEEGPLLDPNNAYTELFLLKNEGYIPITDLQVICTPTFLLGQARFGWEGVSLGLPIKPNVVLAHDGTITLPCFQTVGLVGEHMSAGSTLDIRITYAFFHLNFHPLRRIQSFHFKSVIGTDHAQHWIR
jgi:hypothetical protein